MNRRAGLTLSDGLSFENRLTHRHKSFGSLAGVLSQWHQQNVWQGWSFDCELAGYLFMMFQTQTAMKMVNALTHLLGLPFFSAGNH